MAKKSAVRVTPSTGNVFRDLGFSKEESEHLLVRADLLIQVQKAITSRRLKQAETAKVLRVTQPRVSDLLQENIQGDEFVFYATPGGTFIHSILVPAANVNPPDVEDLMRWSFNAYGTSGVEIVEAAGTEGPKAHIH